MSYSARLFPQYKDGGIFVGNGRVNWDFGVETDKAMPDSPGWGEMAKERQKRRERFPSLCPLICRQDIEIKPVRIDLPSILLETLTSTTAHIDKLWYN